jgi:hypothetical protein
MFNFNQDIKTDLFFGRENFIQNYQKILIMSTPIQSQSQSQSSQSQQSQSQSQSKSSQSHNDAAVNQRISKFILENKTIQSESMICSNCNCSKEQLNLFLKQNSLRL